MIGLVRIQWRKGGISQSLMVFTQLYLWTFLALKINAKTRIISASINYFGIELLTYKEFGYFYMQL
jgi:hypothetical protein